MEKNPMTTTLSLKLPPEVAKIMPWILAAKATADPKQVAWAKREHDIARQTAHWREQRERDAEVRRSRFAYEQQLQEEEQEREFLAWQREQDEQQARLARLGVHFAIEDDGQEYIQPTQGSSSGGLRRQWSRAEEEGIHEHSFWERSWLIYMDHSNQNSSRHNNFRGNKHNCGRKPRKPWFK
jgi:hypothetical protein